MPAIFRQALIEYVRFLPFADPTYAEGLRLALPELYIERAPIPRGEDPSGRSTPHLSEKPSFSDLIREPGARIVLAGEPGAGKTTCLYRLALDCASNGAETDLKPVLVGPHPLPLLFHPRSSDATDELTEPLFLAGHPDLPFTFPPQIKDLLRDDPSDTLATLKYKLQSGGCLILIDGDTIVGDRSAASWRSAIERLVVHYSANRYIVTCRTHMLDALLPLAGFVTYSLQPLGDQEVDAFIARWYPAVTQHQRLAPNVLARRIAFLQGRLRGNEYVRRLAENPLALASYVLVCAEAGAQLPPRSIILRRLLECLLSRHRSDSGHMSVSGADAAVFSAKEQQIDLLATMAMALQAAPASSAGQDATLLRTQVESLLGDALETYGVERGRAVEMVIPHLLVSWQRHGLLAESGEPPAYRMFWRQLREYLAARALTAQPAFATYAYTLRDEPHWRPLLSLATHELVYDNAPISALALPRLLLNVATGAGAVRDILLTAECLLEIGGRAEVGSALHDEVCVRLLSALSSPDVQLADRIQAGLRLGQLGDPRFAQLLPPVAHVAAGPYLFGSREGYEDEGPQQQVDVPAFAIGLYPVTNHEFARFLANVPDHPLPHYWHDGRFDNPSQPVVGVTWEDANAYCRWLTTELHKAGQLPPELVVRLPLEVEWEKAAAWDPQRRVKRRYPWGDEWSSARANTADDRGAWLTVPAGCYPDGVSSYGVHDMIGNVWEWMANEYASYLGAHALFHEEGSYTLRGPSCASLPTHARCTYRSRLPASYWRYHLGFRIVIARPLHALAKDQPAQRQSARAKHRK
jgi:formylglycine-generating enzyme required for sulfatase activity